MTHRILKAHTPAQARFLLESHIYRLHDRNLSTLQSLKIDFARTRLWLREQERFASILKRERITL